MASNVATSAINSINLRGLVTGGDAFDEDAFGRGAFGRDAMAGVAAGMAGNFVRTGLDSRISDSSLSGFAKKYAGGVRTLTGTLGNLASTGVTYAMTDNARVNLINASMFGLTNKDGDAVSVGLFEFGFGKDGVQAAIGMGGTDMNLGRIASSINGINALYQNHKINEYTASHGGIEANVALRALFSYGDDVGTDTYRDILSGKTKLAVNENLEGDATAKTVMNKDGTKTIILRSLSNDVNAGVTAGIVLQHEAYRDGEKSADQQAETRAAVTGHTEMAINVLKDGMYVNAILSNGNLVKDIGNYMKGEDAFREYADTAYDSSGDYWRINEKGNLEYDGRANVYDKDGNLIHETKSQGIEGSMLEILGLEDNETNRASVVAMMKASGLEQNTEGFWIGDNETIRRRIPQGGMSYFYTENGVNLTNLNMGKEITLQSVDSLYSDINASEKMVKGFMNRTYGSAIGMINNVGSYTDAVNDMLSKAYTDSEIKKIQTNREWLNNAVENGIDLSSLAPGASISTTFAEDLRMLALESSSKPGAKFFSELHTGIDFGGGGDSVNTPGGIWQLSRKDDHRLFFELFGSDVKMRIMHLDPDDVAGMSIGDYFGKDSSPAFITNYPTASNGTGTALHTHFDFTGFRLNPAAGQYDRGFLNPATLMPGNQWNYPYSYMDENKNPLPGYPSNFWIY